MDKIQADYTRAINQQTRVLTDLNDGLATVLGDIKLLLESQGRCTRDLDTLEGRIDRRRDDVERLEMDLAAARFKIDVMEESAATTFTMMSTLMSRVEEVEEKMVIMEANLCHCGEDKENEVPEEVLPLGSPLILHRDSGEGSSGDESYHSLSLINPVASSPPSSSESDGIAKVSGENEVAIPIPDPVLDQESLQRLLLSVRGQRASRGRGQRFHPYTRSTGSHSSGSHSPILDDSGRRTCGDGGDTGVGGGWGSSEEVCRLAC